jgi:hypothetical protein
MKFINLLSRCWFGNSEIDSTGKYYDYLFFEEVTGHPAFFTVHTQEAENGIFSIIYCAL